MDAPDSSQGLKADDIFHMPPGHTIRTDTGAVTIDPSGQTTIFIAYLTTPSEQG